MKSKRKQVNKYNFKPSPQPKQSQDDDLIKRSTGIKPFQLTKLRQTQRLSVDLSHANNEILHKRAGSNNLFDEEKEVIDLIIKQKLLIDAQVNNKLESQRKKVVRLNVSNQQIVEECHQVENVENTLILQEEYCQITDQFASNQYTIQSPQNSEILEKNPQIEIKPSEVKRKNNQGCQNLFNNPVYAIVCHKNEAHTHHGSHEIKENMFQQNHDQKIDEASKIEIKLMKQRALPPFSFTSMKWRSKSQILQVDKWKEKYGKQLNQVNKRLQNMQKASSLSKLNQQNSKTNRISEVKSYIHSLENKVSLPILHKNKELDNKNKLFKIYPNNRKQEKGAIVIESNPELDSYSSHLLLSQEYHKKRSSESRKKRNLEEKVEIAIKKMYEDGDKIEEQLQTQNDEQRIQQRQQMSITTSQKKTKSKNKKSKFPQIQITTFYSSKEQEIQKRKLKLESIQRIAREWRYHPPKKVYLQKMMEEIPQRWQYGESRESSRGGQVDFYLKTKQEEAKKQIFIRQLQVKKLELELQKTEEIQLYSQQIINIQ